MKSKLNPVCRFRQVPETIIHKTYTSSSWNRNSIKILSWNIAKNNYNPSWSRDFLEIVDHYQPDKIFLQEVRLRADLQEIAELTQISWAFVPNFIDTSNNTYSGILVASKGDRISKQALVTEHYEPVINTPKVSLFTEYSSGDCSKSLLAVNTHLINFVGLNKFKAQLQEIESVLDKHRGAII